ncbi:hypothetical protein ASPBRDRAFT_35379 [Aspergillus brasiliensis CBS 101740]|uniref:Peptidase M20 domain-containing protein 2 n=1 Tax=Aspergillus brasiliensis (strain CBS 101740 / IMI 381727 / IBT 21946) TaxID=767769 RepID=A0A1L9U386_ASPBC|nr:hypothetical protein ASPBRDRAFT_35379 [Aspergillus brasiliensis CBS 101740]
MAISSAVIQQDLAQSLTTHEFDLWNVSQGIHANPELAFEEKFAHDTICDLLEKLGYSVTRHAYGIDTAFEAEAGSGGGLIVYNAEYDALPGIGHACGHNLIAASSVAAFLATAEALKTHEIVGRVRLLGTPAEEDGGGKVALLKAGAYEGVDACLMGHPGPRFPDRGPRGGVVVARCMARVGVVATFHGVNAHAGNAPWLGRNALDAVVAAYTSIAMLRQQTIPNQRIHAIISKGGDKPNVIPHLTEMQLFVRSETDADMKSTCQRIVDTCEGAAKAAGCSVEFKWTESYKDLQCSDTIADTFYAHCQSQGLDYIRSIPTVSGASTDQGNVSYALPSLHPGFFIDVEGTQIGPHHPLFARAAGSRSGFEDSQRFAQAMAATGLELLQDDDLRKKLWAEHKKRFSAENSD